MLTARCGSSVALLYGTGVRLEECLGLRVKDVDFDRHQVVVRRGTRQKDRVTMLPAGVKERLAAHLLTVKRQHERALTRGEGDAGPRIRANESERVGPISDLDRSVTPETRTASPTRSARPGTCDRALSVKSPLDRL